VRRLADAGQEVAVFHRGRTRTELPEGVGHFLGDHQVLEDHTDELRSFGPEVVLDMIPMNEKDARGVVDVFRGVAWRIVAISSEDVYRAYDVVRGLVPGPPDGTGRWSHSPRSTCPNTSTGGSIRSSTGSWTRVGSDSSQDMRKRSPGKKPCGGPSPGNGHTRRRRWTPPHSTTRLKTRRSLTDYILRRVQPLATVGTLYGLE
jgi:hypothetical protein